MYVLDLFVISKKPIPPYFPAHPELTLPQKRQKVKFTIKVRKASCLLLTEPQQTAQALQSSPVTPVIPPATNRAPDFSQLALTLLLLPKIKYPVLCWGQEACWRCQLTQMDQPHFLPTPRNKPGFHCYTMLGTK